MISSRANASVKSTYRLRRAAERTRRGVLLVEGHRAVAASLAAGVKTLDLFYTPGAPARREHVFAAARGAKLREVSPAIMAYLTDHEHPPDVLAVTAHRPVGASRAARGDFTIVLCGLRDPAVAGGILAAAAAAGATGALAVAGGADVYSPACLRAAAGAHFALPVAGGVEAADALASIAGRRVVLLSDEGTPVCSASMRVPLVVVVGRQPPPALAEVAERICVPSASSTGAPEGMPVVAAGPVAQAAVAFYEVRRP